MLRKSLVTLLVVVMLAALVPASALAQDSVTIRFYNFSSDPDHVEDLQTIIDAFEAENPNITIEVSSAPFADYFTLLEADLVGGDAPDVFELNFESFVSYAANDVLLDLTPYVSGDAPYYPRALEAFQSDGAQYALPESFSTVLLFFNKDLFDQAGIDYPTAEWTWDDAMTAAQAIRALGDDVWGIYSPIQFWEFYKKAAQNNCAFFNADMTESTLNSPECVTALETMVSFVNEDVMPDQTELAGVANEELFLQGKLGMDVIGIWQFAAFADAPFAWDIQLEPGAAQKAHHFFANGVAVSADSEHPEEAAAWAQFLTSSEIAATVRIDAGWELPAIDVPEYVAAYLEQTPPDNREAVFEALESPVTPPVIERQTEMQDDLNQLLTAVEMGELDPQSALDTAKEQIDGLLQ
ncbi:ABC transporter substrate-binding protein [Aggregatilinea lenta]|uniref:ABC transporter substrate-binding protein n=1 Tax=Aggregatilinea lenta TaxID=913108 RepID=UPI000E5BF20E|nr:sugar ABC transporter substrate-binding protein [Aggregatilinea lenta]